MKKARTASNSRLPAASPDRSVCCPMSWSDKGSVMPASSVLDTMRWTATAPSMGTTFAAAECCPTADALGFWTVGRDAVLAGAARCPSTACFGCPRGAAASCPRIAICRCPWTSPPGLADSVRASAPAVWLPRDLGVFARASIHQSLQMPSAENEPIRSKPTASTTARQNVIRSTVQPSRLAQATRSALALVGVDLAVSCICRNASILARSLSACSAATLSAMSLSYFPQNEMARPVSRCLHIRPGRWPTPSSGPLFAFS